MPSIEIWTGLPGSGRTDAAIRRVDEIVSQHGSAWWIVDNLRRVDLVEQSLLDDCDSAVCGVEVFTAGNLAKKMLTNSGRQLDILDRQTNEILLKEIIRQNVKKGFDDTVESDGWISYLVDIQRRIRTGELSWSSIPDNLKWIRSVLRKCDTIINHAGKITEFELPIIAKDILINKDFIFPELAVIERLGPQSPPLTRLIHEFANAIPSTIVIVDYVQDAGHGLDLDYQSYKKWQTHKRTKKQVFQTIPDKTSLAQRLFSRKINEKEDVHSYQVILSEHPDVTTEVRDVAKEIAGFVRNEYLDPDKITVVAADLKSYSNLIKEIFPSYGLLPDLRIGAPLTTSPLAQLVLLLLNVRSNSFRREDVVELLLNPYVKWGCNLSSEESILRFDSAAIRCGITGGQKDTDKSWNAPLGKEIELLRKRAGNLNKRTDRTEEENVQYKEKLLNEASWIEEIRGEFKDLVSLILHLGDRCTLDELSGWLDTLLEQLGSKEKIKKNVSEDPFESNRDSEVLDKLNNIFDSIKSAFDLAGTEKYPVSRISELVQSAVLQSSLKPVKGMHGGIHVTGPREIRGLTTDHLFFLGFSANNWPPKPVRDIISPFSVKWLNGIDRVSEAKSLMLEALLSSRLMHISLPVPVSGEGRNAPSPILSDLVDGGVRFYSVFPRNKNFYSALDLMPQAGKDIVNPEFHQRGLRQLISASGNNGETFIHSKWLRAAQAVQVEWIRNNPETLSRYEGWLTEEEINNTLQARVTANPLSVTGLEQYAQCPMKYFFNRVLQLEELRDVEEEADSAEIGMLVHDILAAAAVRLRQPNRLSLSFSDEAAEIAKVFEEITEEKIAEYPYDNLFWDRNIRELTFGLRNPEEGSGILRLIIDFEKSKSMTGEQIVFAEVSFGSKIKSDWDVLFREVLELEGISTRVSLHGRIDRISLHPEKGWRIWDYKVSRAQKPGASKIKNGLYFQLPVYTLALEKYFDLKGTDKENIDFASFYQVKQGERVSQTGKWKQKDHEAEKDNLKARIIRIYEAIRAGRFHHPLCQNNELCNEDLQRNYCPYIFICRRDPVMFASRESNLQERYLNDLYKLGFQHFKYLNKTEEAG
ncbi:MAG: exodeoxyribonuclease V subunit gamma [Candidatus Electryonea clarkiae]|nr:exodeoxyribonuclease V subunit gamma [Candidatus Electryonea clarkiae]MDP8286943.1 exodeoxyribonuclease V subunit gamma [Candidatus Electryonea clarkiae]